MRSLIHIAAENSNWEILSHLLDNKAGLIADEDCHGASASCQSILVNLAKANQLQLLERLLQTSYVVQEGIQHMLINHWDVDCLLHLENPDLLPLVQKFASEKFARPPLENYTGEEAERLEERLKMNNIQFRGEYHDYEVRWNQPLPTRDEMKRQWNKEKIMYRWEENVYEARGQISGVQVATDGEKINRIRFAYKQTFEQWRATAWTRGDIYWGEGGVEQDPFLLEEGEQVVQLTTHTDSLLATLLGLELLTTIGRHVFWGKKSGNCKRSVTKETFLAYCSGGVVYGDCVSLTFHWEQNKPTPCT